MKILVCVKKVLADEGDIFIKDNGIELECLVYKFNAHDIKAFSEGIAVKRSRPGSIVDIVTVDSADSDSFIRLLLVAGGDNGFRLWDAGLGKETELDNNAIAEILANFIRENSYDLVLFGSRSEFFGAGSLPLIVGCKLGIPAITNVTAISQANDGMLIHKMLEKGRRVVFRCLPRLVLSIEPGDSVDFREDIEGLVRSGEINVNVVSFQELGIDGSVIRRSIQNTEYSYPKPRTKYVLIPESDSVDDRLGFLMSGGFAKKESGVIEGDPNKVAEAIRKSLSQRNVLIGP